jgi:hypothetical protein
VLLVPHPISGMLRKESAKLAQLIHGGMMPLNPAWDAQLDSLQSTNSVLAQLLLPTSTATTNALLVTGLLSGMLTKKFATLAPKAISMIKGHLSVFALLRPT